MAQSKTSGCAVVIAVLALIVFIVVCMGILNTDDSPKQSRDQPASPSSELSPDSGVRAAAHQAAQQVIKPLLKSPSTADFPWETVQHTQTEPLAIESGELVDRWLVSGVIDSQNSLGATLRQEWNAVVLAVESELIVSAVSFDGETVYESESYRKLTESP